MKNVFTLLACYRWIGIVVFTLSFLFIGISCGGGGVVGLVIQPPSQLLFQNIGKRGNMGWVAAQAGHIVEVYAACFHEIVVIFLSDLLNGFQAVCGKARADYLHRLYALARQRLECRIGVGL